MAWNYYDVGIGNVGSYQVSGHPWVTSSVITAGEEKQISFPFVTKSITLEKTTGTGLRIHFAPTGSMTAPPGCYFVLDDDDDKITMNVKCSSVYISNDPGAASVSGYQIFAELTRIDPARMFDLTGSGITE